MQGPTGFQRDLMYAVADLGSPKGLAIKDVGDNYYAIEINHGRLYPNLDSLVEKGLIEKGAIDDRTNSYTPTERGERELVARQE